MYTSKLVLVALVAAAALVAQSGDATAKVRQYYVAADEVDWNYIPAGRDETMVMAPMRYAGFYAKSGPM